MKKIGIITHYYQSNNYGGNLQAYALATYINTIDDCSAEQICFSFLHNNQDNNITTKTTNSFLTRRVTGWIHFCVSFLNPHKLRSNSYRVLNRIYSNRFFLRKKAILEFNKDIIPHSIGVYNESNMYLCNNIYDIFITGSDQVWSGCSKVFSLGFVDENKTKISYAASISRKEVSVFHQDFLREELKTYRAISVRDKTDFEIISKLTEKKVEIVLDPVFLLGREEWDLIASRKRRYNERYLFCYFLGNDRKTKNLITQFARLKHLKIVVISHFVDNENQFVSSDWNFGHYHPFDVSPSDFIALIREAEYVFTDSFHAIAFSIIYNKSFFVFDRIGKYGDMSSRIVNILMQFNLSDRFCHGENKKQLGYLLSLDNIDYDSCNDIMESKKKESQLFLSNCLE